MREDHPAEQYRAITAELYADPPADPPPAPTVAGRRIDWSALWFVAIVVLLLVLYLQHG